MSIFVTGIVGEANALRHLREDAIDAPAKSGHGVSHEDKFLAELLDGDDIARVVLEAARIARKRDADRLHPLEAEGIDDRDRAGCLR